MKCSPPLALFAVCLALALCPAVAPPAAAQATEPSPLPSPEAFFGHVMGEDRELVHYDEMVPYFEMLAERSDRVQLERIGGTTLGRDLVMTIISSPDNLADAERYRQIAADLHDPRGLTDTELETHIRDGKVILLVTLNIHATEIAASQMGMEWAHQLATGGEGSPSDFLEDVIILLVPTVNPDGQSLITEWYRRNLGTPYEGGPMPWLYHPYAGHDNNRDWFMLNLVETRAVNHVAYHQWFPQILVDEHQMGATGPRAFVPPYSDPVSPVVHPLIHRGAMLIGANMAMDLEQAGKAGVIYGYSFDAYWPGGTRSTPWWKNTVGVLTELASVRIASPIYVDPGELAGGRKGLPDYQAQVNFPNPWPGGWWRARDIVEYEIILSNSALRTASVHRETFLRNRAIMARDAVAEGARKPPFGFVIPPEQHDPGTTAKLVDLLAENGLEIYRATHDCVSASQAIPAGSFVIPAEQPLRSFLVEMLQPQEYPEVRVGVHSDEIYQPYDVTAWSLPFLMGVEVNVLQKPLSEASRLYCDLAALDGPAWDRPALIEGPGDHWALSPANNDSYTAVMRLLQRGVKVKRAKTAFTSKGMDWPPGAFLVNTSTEEMTRALDGLRVQAHAVSLPDGEDTGAPAQVQGGNLVRAPFFDLKEPRVGLYQSWLASMDEGWTRYVLDSFGFPVTALHNDEIQSGNLKRSYDVIILPNLTRSQLLDGQWSTSNGGSERRPAPYDGGLGTKGSRALETFVRDGGMLVTFGNAAEFAIEDLRVPVTDVTESLGRDEFSTPGTMLLATIDTGNPLGYGMPTEAPLYHTNSPVLGTRLPGPGRERTVIARFADGNDIVASGWAQGTRHLERRAAAVEIDHGEGRVVMFAFRPQHRAQTHGSYRMLFNAILSSAAE